MTGKRYTDEFRIGALKQVTEHGRRVAEVASRLGIATHSLYALSKTFAQSEVAQRAEMDQSAEVRRLKAELKRMAASMSRRGNCHAMPSRRASSAC